MALDWAKVDIEASDLFAVRPATAGAELGRPVTGNDDTDNKWNSQLLAPAVATRMSITWQLYWKRSAASPPVEVGVFRLNLAELRKRRVVRPDAGGLRLNVFHRDGELFVANSPDEPRIRIARPSW